MLQPDSDALVSGPDAAAYLTARTPHRITGAMVRKWAHRGFTDIDGRRRQLEAVDHLGPRGAARYRWSDLLDAERATRRNPRSPGRDRTLVTALRRHQARHAFKYTPHHASHT